MHVGGCWVPYVINQLSKSRTHTTPYPLSSNSFGLYYRRLEYTSRQKVYSHNAQHFTVRVSVSVADIHIVGFFAVSPTVNELSTWMSVTRFNDSAQAGMPKKMICSQGTFIYMSIVTFCDDNSYSWLSCSYLLNWTYFFLQQPRKRICVPLAVNCGQIVLIALL